MTAGMKRALVDEVSAILRGNALLAERIVNAVCLKLAEGSPEVIEAMLEAMRWQVYESDARAALAAGMKVMADD